MISAREDGFNTNLLEVGSDDAESEICHVMSIVQVLCRAFGLGCKQEEALRNAILYAVHHKKEDESELVAIKTGLQIQETTVAQGLKMSKEDCIFSERHLPPRCMRMEPG